jgi:trk system potassium uptake protein TrkA
MIVPNGDTIIEDGDHVFMVASIKTFEKVLSKIGMPKRRIKSVVIVGAGRMGLYVAEHLLKLGRSVKIIEKDYELCRNVATDFPSALVINGDISDKGVFDDGQLAGCDLIVTTTGNEELNILTAIYAKHLGVKKSIALVNKINYLQICSELGINATVSPKISSVNAVLRCMRRGNVLNVFKVFDGRAEVIEFSLSGSSPLCSKSLRDTKLPSGSLIISVSRGDEHIIPDGNFVLREDDRIMTFSSKDSSAAVTEMFAG